MFGTNHCSSADIGVGIIDENREGLCLLVDQLFHPQVICANPGGTCSRLDESIRFLTQSLAREERIMMENDYSGLGFAVHKREHEKLLRKLNKMKRVLVCGRYDNAVVFDFLTEWIRNHATHYEKPLTDFLRERGMASARKEDTGIRPAH